MKTLFVAEKEELQALIKESIHIEMEVFLKGLNQKTISARLSLVEAAHYLGIKKNTMYQLTSSRKIPFNKLGRRIFFYTKELDDWVFKQSHKYRTMDDMTNENMSSVGRKKLSQY